MSPYVSLLDFTDLPSFNDSCHDVTETSGEKGGGKERPLETFPIKVYPYFIPGNVLVTPTAAENCLIDEELSPSVQPT